jgi:hypothetical protein
VRKRMIAPQSRVVIKHRPSFAQRSTPDHGLSNNVMYKLLRLGNGLWKDRSMAVLNFDASPLAEPALIAPALRLVHSRPDRRPTRSGEAGTP